MINVCVPQKIYPLIFIIRFLSVNRYNNFYFIRFQASNTLPFVGSTNHR